MEGRTRHLAEDESGKLEPILNLPLDIVIIDIPANPDQPICLECPDFDGPPGTVVS